MEQWRGRLGAVSIDRADPRHQEEVPGTVALTPAGLCMSA